MNIYQRLAAISFQVENVTKNLTVEMGNRSYKAVGEGDILKAIKPLEDQYGVYSFPLTREVIETGEIENKNSKSLFMRVKTVYRFVNIDNPSEFVDMVTLGDGVDSQDKAPGKAMTYADKYALMKAYKIQTGDDPDKDGSQDLKSYKKTTKDVKDDLHFPEIEEKKESYYIQVMKILNDSKGKIKSEVVTNWTNQYAKGKKVNDLTPTEFTNLVNFLEHYEQV